MKILYICDTNPQKTGSGTEQRTHRLYEALKDIGDVYVARCSTSLNTEDDGLKVITYRRQKGIRFLINAIWSQLNRYILPRVRMLWLPFPLRSDLSTVFPGVKFDIVVKRYVYGLGLTHIWSVAPLYVDVDDYLMEVFETTDLKNIGRCRAFLARILQRFYLALVERHVQCGWIANASQIPLVHFKNRIAALRNVPNCPGSVYNPVERVRDIIFTVGLLTYEPNYSGVDNFLRNMWPRVHECFPDLKYYIVGKGAPKEMSQAWSRMPGVTVMGFVQNLDDLYRHALASIVPVERGGGTCIKTLEALAHSRCCLATPFGARGISEVDLEEGRHGIFCYKTVDEFVATLSRLKNDVDFRAAHEKAGCAFIRQEFSDAAFNNAVRHVISNIPDCKNNQ